MRYAIVIGMAEGNFCAYVPDLPGCVATGSSIVEVEEQIREAIGFHLDGLREDGAAIPQPSSLVEYVDVAAKREPTYATSPVRRRGRAAPDY